MVRFRVLCSGILGAWSRETADAGKDSGVKYLSRIGEWSVQGCLLEEGGGGSWTSGVEEKERGLCGVIDGRNLHLGKGTGVKSWGYCV